MSFTNSYFIAGIISFVFCIAKFLEIRFVEKEHKALKFVFHDTIIVYVSVIIGHFILQQLQSPTSSSSTITPVFTDNPDF